MIRIVVYTIIGFILGLVVAVFLVANWVLCGIIGAIIGGSLAAWLNSRNKKPSNP